MLKLELPIRELRAALLIAPKKDVREYLNAVHVCFDGPVRAIVATDGAMLLAISSPNILTGAPPPDLTNITIPRDALDSLLRGADKRERETGILNVEVTPPRPEESDFVLRLERLSTSQQVTTLSRPGYPNVARLMSAAARATGGELPAFDYALAGRMTEAFRILAGDKAAPQLLKGETDKTPAVMTCPMVDAVGLIMPYREPLPTRDEVRECVARVWPTKGE